MDLLNIHDTHDSHRDYSRFSRFDSLSRIDSLKQDTLNRLETLNINDSLNRVQRRHSATQQDLSMIRRSPKMQRRSSSSRLDDPLPIPVLKAHSPVAQELKNSVAVNSSRHTSDAVKKLDDKWQVLYRFKYNCKLFRVFNFCWYRYLLFKGTLSITEIYLPRVKAEVY